MGSAVCGPGRARDYLGSCFFVELGITARLQKAGLTALSLLLALFMCAPGFVGLAYADDDTIYETWAEYKAANSTDGITWNIVADEMDKLIYGAHDAYVNGDADTAYHYINDCGYYGWYETTGFERTVMGSIGGGRVSTVELAFSTTRSAAKNGASTDEFKSECDALSALIHEDANILDGVTSGGSGSSDSGASDFELATADGVTIYETWSQFQKANPDAEVTWNVVADEMDKLVYGAYVLYEKGDADTAYKYINNFGYYGWYETTGFERTVMGSIGGGRVSEVELAFSTTRSAAKNGVSNDEFMKECEHLSGLLHEDANILDGVDASGSSDASAAGTGAVAAVGSGGYGSAIATFIAAFGIIVREGIEAILVIGAIIAYLVRSGNKKSLRLVYIGSILGVVCSFVAAWILTITLAASQAPQEIVEGFTALFAVVVLFWVSNWMLSKSESKAWNAYIERQVESSVSQGSVFALAFTAWLAVFREGAEVILFYQPIIQSGEHLGAMWAGFGIGCVVIAVIFILMRFFSVRLPLKPFFLAMSILMAVMCIAFLGSGIKELIEGGLIPATNLGWFPDGNEILNVLGIHPIAETLFPQIILLIITIITFVVQMRRSKKLAQQADAGKADGGAGEQAPAELEAAAEKQLEAAAGDATEGAAEDAANSAAQEDAAQETPREGEEGKQQ